MKKLFALLLAAVLLMGVSGCGASAGNQTINYLIKTAEPIPGNEWTAIALAASEEKAAVKWVETYLAALEAELREQCEIHGSAKAANYARTVLAVTAAGKDASRFADMDLTAVLRDTELVTSQGIAAASYALLALDSGPYPAEEIECYVNFLAEAELPSGGFANSGERADPDSTAMALQALAPYRERAEIAAIIERSLSRLSELQNEDGSWTSWGVTNCESCAQVILALCALGIPSDDPRFVKGGVTLSDDLARYRLSDGSYCHTIGSSSNVMSTLQALQALSALEASPGVEGANTCFVEIRCDALLSRMDDLRENKREFVPPDGKILVSRTEFTEGESVMDVTLRVLAEQNIHFEYSKTPGTNAAYMEGIANLYEFDAGAQSGWEFMVNGSFQGCSASSLSVSPGDAICWLFTCDLGSDVGNQYGA